jgi:hypothetical protein
VKKIALVLLLLVMTIGFVVAQDDQCAQYGGFQNPETERCELHGGFDVDIQYPVGYSTYPNTQDTLDTFVQETYQNFMQGSLDAGWFAFQSSGNWSLTMQYEDYHHSENIVSLAFSVYDYVGGAHGNTWWRTFTFDLTQDEEITLSDLFLPDGDPLSVIAPLVQAEIAAQLGDGTDTTWIAEGTDEFPAEYLNFVLTEDELIFIFPPYQVAPYVAGTRMAHIPLSELESILAEPFAG